MPCAPSSLLQRYVPSMKTSDDAEFSRSPRYHQVPERLSSRRRRRPKVESRVQAILGLEYSLVRERSGRVLLAEWVITLSTTARRQSCGSRGPYFLVLARLSLLGLLTIRRGS